MYIFLVGLFLITFQVACHGAPKHLFPVPQRPAVFQDDKYVEKRDCKYLIYSEHFKISH